MLMRAYFLALLVIALPATQVRSQEIIGIDFLEGDVYAMDCKTGTARFVGYSGLDQHLWYSMCRDSNGILYAGYSDHLSLSGTDIYRIDPGSGQAQFFLHSDLLLIHGLAFSPNNQLFALAERTPFSSFSLDDLYTIDLITGASTLIGATGGERMASIAYGMGTLWGYDGDLGLVRVDPSTGHATDVNGSFIGPLTFNESLCFGDDGQLYLVDTALWILDTNTGVPCLVGSTHYPGILGGAEFVAGSTSPMTLGTLGLSGGQMGLEVWGASPNSTVAFARANGGGGPTPIPSGNPCSGTFLNLNSSLRLAALTTTDAQGHARIGPVVVPAAAAGTLRLQALDLATCRTSNLARVIY